MENLFIYHEKDILFLELIRINTPDYQSLFISPKEGGEDVLVSVFVTEVRKVKSIVVDNELQNVLEVRGNIMINNINTTFRAECYEKFLLTNTLTLLPKRKWEIEIY